MLVKIPWILGDLHLASKIHTLIYQGRTALSLNIYSKLMSHYAYVEKPLLLSERAKMTTKTSFVTDI